MPSLYPALDPEDNYRDIFMPGDCDDSVRELCDAMGWRAELEAIYAQVQAVEAQAAWESLVRSQVLGDTLSELATVSPAQ